MPAGFARGFRRPSAKAAQAAVDTPRVRAPPAIAELAKPASAPPPVPTPVCEDDWLAQYIEPGQTMTEFLAGCPWLSRRKIKYYAGQFDGQADTLLGKYPGGTIYLQPIGSLDDGPPIEALREYTARFYPGACVAVLPALCVQMTAAKVSVKAGAAAGGGAGGGGVSMWPAGWVLDLPHRREGSAIQLQIDGVLDMLRQASRPADALMVVAVTMLELFDSPPDLFVAGMAQGNTRVAVFSLTRYHPGLRFSSEFWYKVQRKSKSKSKGKGQGKGGGKDGSLLLQRCCKLLVHEVGHLLGLDHCVHYACCMNGSGHLAEDFAQVCEPTVLLRSFTALPFPAVLHCPSLRPVPRHCHSSQWCAVVVPLASRASSARSACTRPTGSSGSTAPVRSF
eukprot:SAG22_NODE_170_length_16713_cov_33.746298_5_plen_393_part_00